MKYHILTRFEYWAKKGKVWTEWTTIQQFDNKEDAELKIKELKEKIKPIDKATKLKHEFKTEKSEL